MKKSSISTLLAAALLLASLSADAATITWGTAFDAGSVSDIDVTGGTIVYAMNGGGNSPTAAGISFGASNFSSLPTNVTVVSNAGGNFANRTAIGRITGSTGDAGYDTLLGEITDARGGVTDATMTFGGLTNGVSYQFQVWYADDLGSSAGRIMRYGDGNGNTADLAVNSTFGQTVVGTFTASGASQDLRMAVSPAGDSFGNIHYNGVLLQTIPEPSAYALLAGTLGLTCVMLRRRRC